MTTGKEKNQTANPVDGSPCDSCNSRVRRSAWDSTRQRLAKSDITACIEALSEVPDTVSETRVKQYIEEVESSGFLQEGLERFPGLVGSAFPDTLSGKPLASVLFCYILTRTVRPEVIVETGCAAGWTSTLFLLAMKKNRRGHLYSVDLPTVEGRFGMQWTLPADLDPGFLIPEPVRDRWTLIRGDVRSELLPLLERVKPVDIFLHDSDHTYNHMMWEYTSVWPFLSDNGLIVSDDISMNLAFWDFAEGMKIPLVIHESNLNVGALRRPF